MTLWAPQIYTPHGFTKKDILSGARALDIGCGGRKLPGAMGMDVLKLPGVDIVHNLDAYPWPVRDNEYDLVFANHFVEHTRDVVRTMEEIHRILKQGGRAVIQVPYFRSTDAYTDPTHTHYFTSQSMDYFVEGTHEAAYNYTPARFTKLGFWYGWPHPSRNPLRQALKHWMHDHPQAYDQHLSLIIPTECLTWELEAVK